MGMWVPLRAFGTRMQYILSQIKHVYSMHTGNVIYALMYDSQLSGDFPLAI